MPTLAINTSSTIESVAVIDHGAVLAEISWRANADESGKLLSAIVQVLKKAKKSFEKIEGIIIACGPGPFSAVRIGVTVGNTLASALSVPLYAFSTLAFWRKRKPKNGSGVLMLHAGGHFVYVEKNGAQGAVFEIYDYMKKISTLRDKEIVFYGDITPSEMDIFEKNRSKKWIFLAESELKSFAEIVAEMRTSELKKTKIAEPNYFRPPNITKGKPAVV